jgi:homoserine/homoserine lactone efflux protein
MTLDSYLIFLMTTVIVVFSPGAAAIAIASQGATNGGMRAFFGVVGIALANVLYFTLSATGISSLIIASHQLFAIIKWAGVLYLGWLGLTALLGQSDLIQITARGKPANPVGLFARGFAIELANPKALLYFSAILPQFLDTDFAILPQILIMGGTTLLIDLTAYSIYAFLGERLTRRAMKRWIVHLINKSVGFALLYVGFRVASLTIAK